MIYFYAGAIAEGRLTVCITKFDTMYSSSQSSREDTVTDDMVRKDIIQSIEEAVGTRMSEESVIPLCGKWALAGSKLANCLSGETKEFKTELEDAVSVLLACPHFSLPGGQGQGLRETIRDLHPAQIVTNIEKLTGISCLKERYSY